MRHSLEYIAGYLRELASAWLPASLLSGLSWLGTMFGLPHTGTALVLALTIADWIAGLYLARLTRTFSYARARKGLTKTMVWFAVLVVAASLRGASGEKVLQLFSEWLVFGMVYTELLSVVKNLRAIGTVKTWDVAALTAIEGHIRRFDPTRALPGCKPATPAEEPAAEEVPDVQTRFDFSTIPMDGGEIAVITVTGELDLGNARDLRKMAVEPLAAYGRLRIDLSDVKTCDSSGIGAFLGIVADAKEAGHPLDAVTFWHPKERLSHIFHRTGVDKVLNVERTPGDRYAR